MVIPTPSYPTAQVIRDLQAVNEQLLIASIREQTLTEQLSRQLAFITAITTSLAEGVYVLDRVGQCTFVNRAAQDMLGWTNDELRGQAITVLFPSETPQHKLPDSVLEALNFGAARHDQDELFMHHDGGMFPTSYSVAPILVDQVITGAVITFRDLTAIRQLQREREEYLALISHDLRSPLTVIIGRSQMLLQLLTQREMPNEAKNARIVVESGLRMNAMIETMLERGSNTKSLDDRQRSTFDLVAVVKQILEQTIVPEQQTRVTFHSVATLAVVAEQPQIERVIVNLLTNALKFSPGNTPIEIEVYQGGTEALFVVSDQGVGVTPTDLPFLFQKHYRAETIEQIEGHGLGLYSSRLIVEAHGGRMWAESEVGSGSTFTVALPLPG